MRGYFGIGVEGISKPMNLGNLMRSAHAFGASFFFTVDPAARLGKQKSDTSKSPDHLPLYAWDTVGDMRLPDACDLVGIELTDEAIDLPSFGHPRRAAYVLGPERGALSEAMLDRCTYVVKIPTAFCINVAMAGAIVMYDRARSLGRFDPRPITRGAPTETLPDPVFGQPIRRLKGDSDSDSG